MVHTRGVFHLTRKNESLNKSTKAFVVPILADGHSVTEL